VGQIEPTADLLLRLDERHPEVLEEVGVAPKDYHGGMVFASAIESLRGRMAAARSQPREQFVGNVLKQMQEQQLIVSFDRTPIGVRWDFTAVLDKNPVREIAIEVKGGEGNSLNISNRPEGVAEFIVWCHLDGSLQHDLSRSVRQILGRLVADIVKAPKRIDALLIRDQLCGTGARPCPKPRTPTVDALGPPPDIFLFPSAALRFGTSTTPKPHTSASCVFPFRVLSFFGVQESEWAHNVHEVSIRLYYQVDKPMREVVVTQSGREQFRHSAPVTVR